MSVLRMQKVWNSTYSFTNFSWKSRVRKQKRLDFGCMCGFFMEIRVKNKDFFKKKKTLEIQDLILPKKSLEIQPPLWGRAKFFWNSPFGPNWKSSLKNHWINTRLACTYSMHCVYQIQRHRLKNWLLNNFEKKKH